MNLDSENVSMDSIRESAARVQDLQDENNRLRNEMMRPNTPLVPTNNMLVQPNFGAIASKPPKYDGTRRMVTL